MNFGSSAGVLFLGLVASSLLSPNHVREQPPHHRRHLPGPRFADWGFLKKRPVGKILEGEKFIGNNWAQDAGVYEFTFNDGSKVKAR